MIKENELVLTGTFLGNSNEFIASDGTYLKNNQIFAAIPGVLSVKEEKNRRLIEIKPRNSKSAKTLNIGSEILGRIVKIKEDYVTVRILCIENEPIQTFMQGVIRRVHVRLTEIDKIKIEQCFLPGDIIKARVLSYGDSQKIYLSTLENDLGVLFARSLETNSLMLPLNWKEMIDPETGIKETRKVAMPNFSYFSDNI